MSGWGSSRKSCVTPREQVQVYGAVMVSLKSRLEYSSTGVEEPQHREQST